MRSPGFCPLASAVAHAQQAATLAVAGSAVDAYHQRLRSWLARFHGVALRYPPNYPGWRWALDGERIASPERLLRAAVGIFHT